MIRGGSKNSWIEFNFFYFLNRFDQFCSTHVKNEPYTCQRNFQRTIDTVPNRTKPLKKPEWIFALTICTSMILTLSQNISNDTSTKIIVLSFFSCVCNVTLLHGMPPKKAVVTPDEYHLEFFSV